MMAYKPTDTLKQHTQESMHLRKWSKGSNSKYSQHGRTGTAQVYKALLQLGQHKQALCDC